MIISRTPFRVSFIGGGSDIPNFYSKYKGAVISTSIDKYIYIALHKTFDKKFHINYSTHEVCDKIKDIKHPIVRGLLKSFKTKIPIEISSMADIQSNGSGLGSSSSYTVGLINLLLCSQKKNFSKEQIARKAYLFERNILKEGAGKQDQYAAAYGGFNLMEFFPDESVKVKKIECDEVKKKNFENSILVFYTGHSRSAYKNLLLLNKNLEKKKNFSNAVDIVKLTFDFLKEVKSKFSIYELGRIIDENWRIKKILLKNTSNDYIDHYYEIGKKNGALGGKILGAGNGGFLMFVAPKNKHNRIIKSLNKLEHLKINFETKGSQIIFNDSIK